ncbi:SDR family NAD(P)-dependent oxidoreductase [Paraburkholderia sp. EG287B]|uniref:SDR family NAD(P)-dependent oxidoreductase n=1 Tax=Paraburkholderia sp. EG287B TaxID=3237010 RepID=UPI0034D30B4F
MQRVQHAVHAFGKLNVLVNDAGISTYGLIEHLDDHDWEKTLAVNLSGVFQGIRATIPAMRSAGSGSIVNISSAAGMLGNTGLPAYVAPKFGVRGLTIGSEFIVDGGQTAGAIVWGFDDDSATSLVRPIQVAGATRSRSWTGIATATCSSISQFR